MTTNEGTPTERHDRTLDAADRGADRHGGQHREDAVRLPAAAGELELGYHQRADAREVADREVDLTE